ncbi:excinuclease ABC subunit A, partial [Carnobacterium antarcticum]|uniref:DinB/UmuC family translesion DNA polymerase n=1 Tax=Carnobacterium antarcticum TaxID=2126436 RepID=UPI0036148C1A
EINDIFRKYVSDEDLHIYSIDESFVSVRASLKLFKRKSAYDLARMIQYHIHKKTGLYVTIGIGDNMLLAKLALDNEAKCNANLIAEWRYKDVPETIWKIENITDMWGIGERTAIRLNSLGIKSVYDLAHANFYQLRESMGLIGEQLYAGAWGIDRSDIRDQYRPLEKSYGNSQILKRDYYKRHEIKIVIREMAEQVATRIRKHHCKTGCVSLTVTYSKHEEKAGFSRQLKIPNTSNTKKLVDYCFDIFNKHYEDDMAVRSIGISYSKLTYTSNIQLDLFEDPTQQIANEKLDLLVDKIRDKYGFQSLVHASSLLEGATAINRSSLVGGHAGGMEGIQ